MKMVQIEQVLAIASEGSINKAAQRLYMSQPNLSFSLKQLEEELGSRIFERTGKGVTLTRFGKEFLSYAQPSYRQFKLLGEFCRSLIESHPLTISVASQYFRFANSLFIDICKKYEKDLFQFSFLEGNFQEVFNSVRQQESEVGVIILSSLQKRILLHLLQNGGMTYHRLSENDVAVIVAKDHPICSDGRTQVRAQDLRDYPMVVYRDVDYNFTPEWNTIGIDESRRRIMVTDRATLNELIATTDAYTVGVHNEHAYKNTQYYTNVTALKLCDSQVTLEIGYIVNKSRPLSPIAQEYLDAIARLVR